MPGLNNGLRIPALATIEVVHGVLAVHLLTPDYGVPSHLQILIFVAVTEVLVSYLGDLVFGVYHGGLSRSCL